jgi:hypothetical protein
MKRMAIVGVAVMAVGCAGVSKQELESVKAECQAHTEKTASTLRSEMTKIDTKYIDMQQLGLKVEKQLRDLDELQKSLIELSKKLDVKVDLANTNVVKVLEFEETMLAERLATVRSMLADLKKK